MAKRRKPPRGPYTIGYGRPPAGTWFKPGKSGNPKGRPKGRKNLTTYIEQELDMKIPITENQQHKLIPKKQAIAKQLVNQAALGDLKAGAMLMNQIAPHEEATVNATSWEPTDADKTTMENLFRRIREAPDLEPDSLA